jgi:hypothetical protein
MEDKNNTTFENKISYLYIDDEKENKTHIYYKDTFIYGWGKNKYGELGIGHTNNILYPR